MPIVFLSYYRRCMTVKNKSFKLHIWPIILMYAVDQSMKWEGKEIVIAFFYTHIKSRDPNNMREGTCADKRADMHVLTSILTRFSSDPMSFFQSNRIPSSTCLFYIQPCSSSSYENARWSWIKYHMTQAVNKILLLHVTIFINFLFASHVNKKWK